MIEIDQEIGTTGEGGERKKLSFNGSSNILDISTRCIFSRNVFKGFSAGAFPSKRRELVASLEEKEETEQSGQPNR